MQDSLGEIGLESSIKEKGKDNLDLATLRISPLSISYNN